MRGYLISTTFMFAGFALAWHLQGHLTLKKEVHKQKIKIAVLAMVFALGSWLM
eukprot:m.284552 g.284552  ORF g.284552 m.284552 type:complete len:53 (-) comp17766_c0_seq2:24-182(-)